MKRILLWLLALTLVLSLCTCAFGEAQTSLRFAWWGGQARNDSTTEVIEAFAALNPGLTTEVEFAGFDDHFSKLATQAAADMLPDVIAMDYSKLTSFAQNGLLEPLDSYIESGVLDLTNVPDSAIAGGYVDDQLYAVCSGINAPCLLYNKTLLDSLGLTLSVEPTWDELIDIAKTVYEQTGVKAQFLTDSYEQVFEMRLRNMGLSLYNADNTALGFDDPQLLADWWQVIVDAEEGGYGPAVGEMTGATDWASIGLGQNWISISNSNGLAGAETEAGGDIELAICTYPNLSDAVQPCSFIKPSQFWSVTSTSQNKEQAVAFISYFTNTDSVYDVVGTDRGMPISSAVRAYLTPGFSSADQRAAAYLDYLSDGHSTPIAPPYPAVHNEVIETLAGYTEQVNYDLVTDLTAHAQAFMDEANEILAR